MSDANNPIDPKDANDLWSKEQAPFAGSGPAEAVPAVGVDAAAATAGGGWHSATSAGATIPDGEAYGASSGGNSAGTPPAGAWGMPPGGYAVPPPPPVGSPSEPNPVLAAFLGFIPGVGAMYNGQFAKGIVHVVVFAVLVFFANNVNDIFGIFVTGWIFFMAFEAYHTAKARRDGLPLPNAFGWNEIGERMGLGKNWPFSPGSAATASATGSSAATAGAGTGNASGWTAPVPGPIPPAYATAPAYPTSPVQPAGAASYGAAPGTAPGTAPNWAGYVPPTAFASSAGSAGAGTGAVPPGQGVPYSPVSAGAPYSPIAPGVPSVTSSRLPVGAMWLIGLGVLFLLGQWTPLLQISRVWIPSVLLVGIAGLLFARRMGWTGPSVGQRTALPVGLRAASAVRIPGILVAVAVLNGLHEAWVVRWNRSWPWLLICVGVLLLIERMALRQAANLDAAIDPTLNGGL